ncbi:MAG: hypothetical protein M1608_06545 [Candidatus Omnitrophica bacterium]|nr:hypothetical protein [Candidatus Omnitrophota bacterium]
MKSKSKLYTRRAWLRQTATGLSAAIAVPIIIPQAARGQSGRPSPSNCLTMGMIGLGSMGMRNLQGFLQENDCRIIAVCDVDASRRKDAIQEVNKSYGGQGCAQYNDFRELIDDFAP